MGVDVDSAGNLYIADYMDRRIRQVSHGTITTVAGGGSLYGNSTVFDQPAVGAVLSGPRGVVVDSAGNIFFTDSNPNMLAGHVYRVTSGLLTVIAGDTTGNYSAKNPGDGGPATDAVLGFPSGIAAGPAGLIFADSNYGRIRGLIPAGAPSPPTISTGEVVNAASLLAGPVAPGSIVAVFGSFGLNSPSQADAVPLPTALTGFSIEIGGVNAPLFYASGTQANLQVPWELAGQSSATAAATVNGVTGPSRTVQLAPSAPAIFTMNGTGAGQGAITDTSYHVADASNPVSAGSVIQIYCTGLGAVTNPPASGTPASAAALSQTITTPTVTIGDIPAVVSFSGLVPGAVGEYQVNAQVAAGVTPGPTVPVVISIGDAQSNTVTMAVK